MVKASLKRGAKYASRSTAHFFDARKCRKSVDRIERLTITVSVDGPGGINFAAIIGTIRPLVSDGYGPAAKPDSISLVEEIRFRKIQEPTVPTDVEEDLENAAPVANLGWGEGLETARLHGIGEPAR